MSGCPSQALVTRAADIMAALDAPGADPAPLVAELRTALAAERLGFVDLARHLVSPLPAVIYVTAPSYGPVWPPELRAEALRLFERHAWRFAAEPGSRRRLHRLTTALQRRRGRLTWSDAHLAERLMRACREAAVAVEEAHG